MKSNKGLLDHLEKKGVVIEEDVPSLFGYALKGYYPLGERKVSFSFLFVSLSKTARLLLTFPIYHQGDLEMEEAYDRFFPKEKNQWGRSNPPFRQAIIDYMRGQALCPMDRRNSIEIKDEEGVVEIRLIAKWGAMGEKGMLDAFRKIQYELEMGQLHRDVLTHLFAF